MSNRRLTISQVPAVPLELLRVMDNMTLASQNRQLGWELQNTTGRQEINHTQHVLAAQPASGGLHLRAYTAIDLVEGIQRGSFCLSAKVSPISASSVITAKARMYMDQFPATAPRFAVLLPWIIEMAKAVSSGNNTIFTDVKITKTTGVGGVAGPHTVILSRKAVNYTAGAIGDYYIVTKFFLN